LGTLKFALEPIVLRKLSLLALAALLLSSAAHVAAQQMPHHVFSLGVAGVATPQANVLSVVAPLANLTNRAVADVKIDRVELAKAPVQTPLPMTVGTVRASSSVLVQAEFNSQSLPSGQRYELVIQGTYRGQDRDDEDEGGARTYPGQDRDDERRFRVHTFVVIPPPSEGSGQLGTTQVPSQKVEGGRYPPQPPRMDKDVNSGAPPVPTNPEVPGAPTPTGSEVKPATK
jgi:hypothetical protein